MNRAIRMEVLPSPAEAARLPLQRAELDRLVQEKVAEILQARDEFMFEPWFRSRKVAYELKRLQTVSEQRTFTIYFERFGCLICETRERIHGGRGMCVRCYQNTLGRLKQIRGEQIREEIAKPARGRLRLDRLLPENAPINGVHHTRYERSTKRELNLFVRVARQLGLTPHYVRAVGVGLRRSEAVSAVLRKEAEKMRKDQKD